LFIHVISNPPTMRFLKTTFIIVSLVSTQYAVAQRNAAERADKLFDKFNYAEALDEYFFQYGKDTTDVHVNRMIGMCFRKLGLLAKSADWFEQVIDLSEATPEDKLHYAEGLRARGEYDRAVFWYRRYAHDAPNDRRAKLHIDNPLYYNNLLADSLKYDLFHLEVNTDKPSFGMGPFNDRFVFSSAGVRDYAGNTNNQSELAFLNLYTCDLDPSGEFINVEPLKGAVNSKYHDGPACFDATQQVMYITRNNMKGNKPMYDQTGTANLKIYAYALAGEQWIEAPELPFNSMAYSVGHPTLASDGSFMVFVSNMPGGFGGTDLYISFRTGDVWTEPLNLGAEINTEGDEMFPFISNQGNLYFASDGHAGLGGLDLFISHRADELNDVAFERPSNLGAPINSSADDFSLYYDEGDEWGYFSSNRGGLGKDNLYRFTRKHFSHQIFAATLSSRELVSLASKQVRLHNLVTSQDSILRLDETGSFRAMVKAGHRYALFLGSEPADEEQAVFEVAIDQKLVETYRYGGVYLIDRQQLLAAGFIKERKLALPSIEFAATTGSGILERLEKLRDSAKLLSDSEFSSLSKSGLIDGSELDALVAGQSELAAEANRRLSEQRLNNLHFGFDSYTIRSTERRKITALAEMLNEEPEAKVVIKAHTDIRGDENYNLLLSMRRAKSVQKALIERGIPEERIRIAWVGSNELLIDCSEQPCTSADHALNRRAEIVLLSANHQAHHRDDE